MSDIAKQIEEKNEAIYGKKCTRCEMFKTYCRCVEFDKFSIKEFTKPADKYKFYFSINGNTKQEFAESTDLKIQLKPIGDSKGTLLEFTDSHGNTFEVSAEKINK